MTVPAIFMVDEAEKLRKSSDESVDVEGKWVGFCGDRWHRLPRPHVMLTGDLQRADLLLTQVSSY